MAKITREEEGRDKATIGGKKRVVSDVAKVEAPAKGANVVGQVGQDKRKRAKETKEHSWHRQEDRHGGMHGRIDGERHESVKPYEATDEGYEHTSEDR